MLRQLKTGQRADLETVVALPQTIHLDAKSSAGGAVVFSTPSMINLMEHAARKVLAPFLEEGEESVGAGLEVKHLAPTPVGARVRAEAEVTAIDKRMVDFKIRAYDAHELIGEGTHRRAIIRMERFLPVLQAKQEKLNLSPDAPSTIAVGPFVLLETAGPVATLTLNRPQKLNAMHTAMTEQLENALEHLSRQSSVRVVIVRGAGKAFCAGEDIGETGGLAPDDASAITRRRAACCDALSRLPQVTVAVIQGACMGGGLVLALACDFRLASHDALFSLPEVRLGWPPAYGLAALIDLVGRQTARELCLTGRKLVAGEAEQIGLIDGLAGGSLLESKLDHLITSLLATPTNGLRETKVLLREHRGSDLWDSAPELQSYRRCLADPEARGRIQGFLKK